jgi:hypothetical protein
MWGISEFRHDYRGIQDDKRYIAYQANLAETRNTSRNKPSDPSAFICLKKQLVLQPGAKNLLASAAVDCGDWWSISHTRIGLAQNETSRALRHSNRKHCADFRHLLTTCDWISRFFAKSLVTGLPIRGVSRVVGCDTQLLTSRKV